ncbi:unnamed protein product [Cylicocyclus nassatus]|uniref:Potassium channel tetramerisation-type BTB domain-containing protein n=1 Tax=Cylicocyclus nassatus TaxID=53992 RepID=A0AA36GV19_CYLNA|nr:unnamed protein product [Cylicocyclus nassatus]
MLVVLNLRGTKFETSLETLRRNPGPRDNNMLANLDYVEGEEVYIDRDPMYFTHILNYLQAGSVSVGEHQCILAHIKREAQNDYFIHFLSVLWTRRPCPAHRGPDYPCAPSERPI